MKTAAVICHARFLGLASFADPLRQRGYAVRYYDAGLDDLSYDEDPDVLIALGGPVSAFQDAEYPWIKDEMQLLRKQLGAGRPVLGVCLGAQILAQSLGARVYRGETEIGWAPIKLTDAGKQSALGCMAEPEMPVLHWHQCTFDLPAGAKLLGSSERCENQAYSIGSALAVQFHPEVDARHFEGWLICNSGQIAMMTDHSVSSLRAQARLHANSAAALGQKWFGRWLDQITEAKQ